MSNLRLFIIRVGTRYCGPGQAGYHRTLRKYDPKLRKTPKVWVGVGPFKCYLKQIKLPPEAEILELVISGEKVVDNEEFAGYL